MAGSNIVKLQKKTCLKMIENSIGSKLFNSLFVKFKDTGKVADVLKNGELSCAFFVSGILTLCNYLDSPHATVKTTEKELIEIGCKKVKNSNIKPADIIIWEKVLFPNGSKHSHIGFALNKTQAVSTNYKKKKVIKHHITYNNKRKIIEVFRLP